MAKKTDKITSEKQAEAIDAIMTLPSPELRLEYYSERRDKFIDRGYDYKQLDNIFGYSPVEAWAGSVLETDTAKRIVGSKPAKMAFKVAEVFGRPQQAIYAGANEAVKSLTADKPMDIKRIGAAALMGLKGKTSLGFNDILATYQGMNPEDYNDVQKAVGTFIDMGLDPLNFVNPTQIGAKGLRNFVKAGKAAAIKSGNEAAIKTFQKLEKMNPKQIGEIITGVGKRKQEAALVKGAIIRHGAEAEQSAKGVSEAMAPTARLRPTKPVDLEKGEKGLAIQTQIQKPVETTVERTRRALQEEARQIQKTRTVMPKKVYKFEKETSKPSIKFEDDIPVYTPQTIKGREVIQDAPNPYQTVTDELDIFAGRYRTGEIEKPTYYKHVNETLKRVGKTGFDTEAINIFEQGSNINLPKRVWAQIDDDTFATIQGHIDNFQKQGGTADYVKAIDTLRNSKPVQEWERITQFNPAIEDARMAFDGDVLDAGEAIAPMIKKETADKLRFKYKRDSNAKEILVNLFGTDKWDDLTESEGQLFDYYAKHAKKAGKGLDYTFDDIEKFRLGEFVKPYDIREPGYFENVTKTMFGSPEIIMRELGLDDVWKSYSNAHGDYVRHSDALYSEMEQLSRDAHNIDPNNSRTLFNAINQTPEQLYGAQQGKTIQKVFDQIKKVNSTELPETMDIWVDKMHKITVNPRDIVEKYNADLVASAPEALRPHAERIIGVYGELADGQKLPWTARRVPYITHLSKYTVVKNLEDIGYFKRLEDGSYEMLENLKTGGRVLKKGDTISEDDFVEKILPSLQKDRSLPVELQRVMDKMRPKEIKNPFLKKRTGADLYLEDAWGALDAYMRPALRSMHFNTPYQMAESVVRNPAFKDSLAAKFLAAFNDNMRGVGLGIFGNKEMKTGGFAKAAYTLANNAYLGALAIAPDSALRNLTQGISTISELGPKYTMKGYGALFTKEGRKLLMDSGIINEAALKQYVLMGAQKPGFYQDRFANIARKWDKIKDKSMILFQGAEYINKGSTYLAALKKFKDAPVEGFKTADEYAKAMVNKLQFAYSEIDMPLALQSPSGKTLGQFYTYPIKQTELVTGWIKNGDYDKLDRFLKLNYAVLKAGNLTDTDTSQLTLGGISPVQENVKTGGLKYQPPPIPSLIINAITAQVSEPGSDVHNEAVNNLKSNLAIMVPGGRYGKKVADWGVTAYKTRQARQLEKAAAEKGIPVNEIPKGMMRQYQQFGEFQSPLTPSTGMEVKRDVPTSDMYRSLAGFPSQRSQREYKISMETKREQDVLSKKVREQYGLMREYSIRPTDGLKERIRKLSRKTGINPESVYEENSKRIADGRKSLFEVKQGEYLGIKIRNDMATILRMKATGSSPEDIKKEARKRGLDKLTSDEKESALKSHLKDLLKRSSSDPRARDEYIALVKQMPDYALTVEEANDALMRIK